MARKSAPRADSQALQILNAELVECRSCPRLVAWREQVAREKVRRFREWNVFVVAGLGAFLLNRTGYGRHVAAVGSNEEVARYSGIRVGRVRIMTYILQGLCVSIAVILYVPRLGSTTATTGIMCELQAITAVIIGGTALTGGVGRIWGSICGAFLLETVGDIMILSNYASEYLIGAIQGTIIIVSMLIQRSLIRKR